MSQTIITALKALKLHGNDDAQRHYTLEFPSFENVASARVLAGVVQTILNVLETHYWRHVRGFMSSGTT